MYDMGVDVYEGDYEDDKFNGLGRMTYNSGDIYEGEFKNNRMDGRGKCYFVTGDVYEGSFKEHDVDGEGRFIYANGVVYNAEKDTIEEWDLDSGGGAATASPTVTNDVRTQALAVHHLGGDLLGKHGLLGEQLDGRVATLAEALVLVGEPAAALVDGRTGPSNAAHRTRRRRSHPAARALPPRSRAAAARSRAAAGCGCVLGMRPTMTKPMTTRTTAIPTAAPLAEPALPLAPATADRDAQRPLRRLPLGTTTTRDLAAGEDAAAAAPAMPPPATATQRRASSRPLAPSAHDAAA